MTLRLADRYALVEQIGMGGSARVYEAVDERLGRRVAVKVLGADLAASADPAARDRFLREGATSASFVHPNAVTVYDAGEDDGELFIVMELVDGQSLAHHLATDGPLPIHAALSVARQVLAALAAAHASGIVHRDVKPANILLARNGEAKLTDFGIAKRLDEIEESVTRIGTAVGTPRYLAPEQARGEAVSPAADLYAMGIVLHEMLTGRTPFGDHPATEPAPDVPPAIAHVIAQALQPDPAARFASATDMSVALYAPPTEVIVEPTAVLASRSGGTAVLPAAPTTPAPTRRRRSPLPLAIAILAIVGVGARMAMDENGLDAVSHTTTASTSAAPASVIEIIPGFPATDDLSTFLAQLRAEPGRVGAAGPELANDLDALLAQTSDAERSVLAQQLIERMRSWTESGQLHPAIAEALSALVSPLIIPVEDGDDGDDGGNGNGKGKKNKGGGKKDDD